MTQALLYGAYEIGTEEGSNDLTYDPLGGLGFIDDFVVDSHFRYMYKRTSPF